MKQRRKTVSLGEPCFSCPDDSEVFSPARIRRFSQYILSRNEWFRTAGELIEAMELLESHIDRFWEDAGSITFAAELKGGVLSVSHQAGAPPKKQNGSAPKHNLINQHMMLAGFAIENLCKGYFADRITAEERQRIEQEGIFPGSWKDHDTLRLVEQTGLTLSGIEKDLLTRIADTVQWRGRYPSPISHRGIRPFFHMGGDNRHIKTLLHRLRRHVGAKD